MSQLLISLILQKVVMPFNESPCFYICQNSIGGDYFLLHLCSPSWFAKLTQIGGGVQIGIIKHFGPPPDKEIELASLKEAEKFVRDYVKSSKRFIKG